MGELEEYYKQISTFQKLKINEAKKLYIKAINTDDEDLKKLYMDELVLGTLHVVYNYIKNSDLNLFTSQSYDMKDIISSFTEVWIRRLNDGELLKVECYSFIFRAPYFLDVYENLCGDKIDVGDQFGISAISFADLFDLYVSYKSEETNKSFEEVLEEKLQFSYISDYYYHQFIRLIPTLENLYNSLNIDNNSDLKLNRTKISNYLRLIINNGLVESMPSDIHDPRDFEGEMLDKIQLEDFICDVDRIIKDERAKSIIFERFGIDGDGPKTLEAVGKIHHLSRDRVRQIEAKTIRYIYRNRKMDRYEE